MGRYFLSSGIRLMNTNSALSIKFTWDNFVPPGGLFHHHLRSLLIQLWPSFPTCTCWQKTNCKRNSCNSQSKCNRGYRPDDISCSCHSKHQDPYQIQTTTYTIDAHCDDKIICLLPSLLHTLPFWSFDVKSADDVFEDRPKQFFEDDV